MWSPNIPTSAGAAPGKAAGQGLTLWGHGGQWGSLTGPDSCTGHCTPGRGSHTTSHCRRGACAVVTDSATCPQGPWVTRRKAGQEGAIMCPSGVTSGHEASCFYPSCVPLASGRTRASGPRRLGFGTPGPTRGQLGDVLPGPGFGAPGGGAGGRLPC